MHRLRVRAVSLAALMMLSSAAAALGQTGPITLTVDATRAPEKILHSTMVIPVTPGPLTLYYPKWIPGEHAASGPIANVTGLKFTANGKTLYWQRDTKDAFTLHVDVPQGATSLDVAFDYLEPGAGQFTGGSSATARLVVISWNQNLLYPAGTPAQQLTYDTKLVLPSGWKFGTALPTEGQSGDSVTFKPVELNRLVDSPVIAGQYYRAIDLTPSGESVHHEIDMVADSAEALDMSPQVQTGLKNLVVEAGRLFGSRHYRDYHFLLTLSDHVAHFGLEHHESNDSRLGERALLSPHAGVAIGGLLAHEYAHSWNGKFRRPADLSTPYYEAPEETDLLWVYKVSPTSPVRFSRPAADCGHRTNIATTWPALALRSVRVGRAAPGVRCSTPQSASRYSAARAAAGRTGAAAPTTTMKAICCGSRLRPSFTTGRTARNQSTTSVTCSTAARTPDPN